MKTQQEHEIEIVKYFNIYQKDILEERILKTDTNDKKIIKCGYYFFGDECHFGNDPIDYAIWDVEKKAFIYIEYPWRNKKGKLIHAKNSNGFEEWYDYDEKGKLIHRKYKIGRAHV